MPRVGIDFQATALGSSVPIAPTAGHRTIEIREGVGSSIKARHTRRGE